MYSVTPTKPDKVFMDRLIVKKAMASVNSHRVGRIVAFYKEDLTCDVQMLEQIPQSKGGSAEFSLLLKLPLIIEGTDTKHITFGNIVGSECLVHFNDRDIDNWFKTGESYKPNTTRLHSFSDGFVTLRPYSKVKTFTYYEGGIEIKNGNTIIHLNDDGTVDITATTIIVNGNVVVNGDLTASGTITGETDVLAGSGSISGANHVHTGNLGTDTSKPHAGS